MGVLACVRSVNLGAAFCDLQVVFTNDGYFMHFFGGVAYLSVVFLTRTVLDLFLWFLYSIFYVLHVAWYTGTRRGRGSDCKYFRFCYLFG